MLLAEVLIERSVNSLNRPFIYECNLKDDLKPGVRVIVNFNNKDVMGYVVKTYNDNRTKLEYENETGYSLNAIKEIIDTKPILSDELLKLAHEVSEYYLCPLISVLQTMLPSSLKPKISSLKAPKIHYVKYLTIMNKDESNLTLKQIEILRLISSRGKVLKNEIKNKSIIYKLLKLNRIKEINIESSRFNLPEYQKEKDKKLTSEQISAVRKILESDNKISLLEGVTGSGKTEVYLKLSEEVLKQGRNVLMLVPEISLTNVMVEYFVRRFNNKVAILHSELTDAEKYDEYRKIANGDAKVVVGARSAIFAPLKNIGLIILDEEHVESYKQENTPYYHARDVAIMRAKTNKSFLVLGSATPLLETRIRAMKKIYNHIKLSKRINERPLPKTQIVDMLKTSNLSNKSYIFSKLLIEKIKDRLDKNEQIILLINRRGYSTSIVCRECGQSIKCPNCKIPLTYHQIEDSLKCHHCGHIEKMPNNCPNCGSTRFIKNGFGTEKIEKEINRIFPQAKTLRLDSDVGKVRNNISKVIEKFRNQEANILIGTQMVAKGHDFPNVTLVGLVLADIGLSLPSFRNSERVFTLITQAIGRSGRDQKDGEAIIQTYMPNHYAITLGSIQDYDSFFLKEMNIRKAGNYPPYSYLINILIKAKNEKLVNDFSYQLINDLLNKNFKDVTILGPSTPYIPYSNAMHIRNILIKYKKADEIIPYINNLRITLQNKPTINIIINVDPYEF